MVHWVGLKGLVKRKRKAKKALYKLGMLDYKDSQISELSGGQQQECF